MMMKLNYHALLYIGMLPLLAACSTHDDSEGLASYEGFPKEVILSATTVNDINSRASDDESTKVWEDKSKVAIHMKVSDEDYYAKADFKEATYCYLTDIVGKLTAADESKKFYFRSLDEPARTCDAWYWPSAKNASGEIIGYSKDTPVDKPISVPVDQSKTPHAVNDFLYAPPTAIKYNSKNPNMVYSLLFCHQLTWVSFQVVADNSSSYDKSDLSATMGTETEPLIYQATFSAPSGQTTRTGSREVFGAYSSTENDVKKGVITPHPLETPDVDGIICRYEAVLIPQALSADGTTTHNLFNMVLGGKTYRYNSTMDLKAGVHYTFNLKIAKGDKPLLVLAKADDWQNESVAEMEKLHVIAKFWTGGPLPGTTTDGEGWKDKENHGSSNSGNDWDDEETTGSTNSGLSWGSEENHGSSNSGNSWGSEENTGVSGAGTNWEKNEGNSSVTIDANSWKKDASDSVGVTAGQDWQKEGETQYW